MSIEGTAFSAVVPYGTDVTALIASFTATGASVNVGGLGYCIKNSSI